MSPQADFLPTDLIIVLTTTPTAEEAEHLANLLVERSLVACVNIIPGITSIFSWEGKIERATEYLLLCKTLSSHFIQVQEFIVEKHSYDTPEIVAIPSTAVGASYLSWVTDLVGNRGARP